MKILILLASMLFSAGVCADKCSPVYAKVGAGYKFVEYKYSDFAYVSPYSARIEVGVECGSLSFGVAHQSQWATGWPVNKVEEPNKTEIFIDYKIYFW
jgi:hypothetical protein